MDIAPIEERRLDAKVDRPRTHIGRRSRNRLLHHVLQIAGHGHATLAGHHDAFNRQQLAANFRPGEASDETNLVRTLDFAVAELRHAKELAEVLERHRDLLLLAREDFLHGFTGERRDFALEIADAGLPRVTA